MPACVDNSAYANPFFMLNLCLCLRFTCTLALTLLPARMLIHSHILDASVCFHICPLCTTYPHTLPFPLDAHAYSSAYANALLTLMLVLVPVLVLTFTNLLIFMYFAYVLCLMYSLALLLHLLNICLHSF